jgi:hypothetical protein
MCENVYEVYGKVDLCPLIYQTLLWINTVESQRCLINCVEAFHSDSEKKIAKDFMGYVEIYMYTLM